MPLRISRQFLVGIDRECEALSIDISEYLRIIIKAFQDAPLREGLKGDVLADIDIISYSGRSYVVIRVPAQRDLSNFADDYLVRDGEDLRRMSTSERVFENLLIRSSEGSAGLLLGRWPSTGRPA
jgi:hypothetical protein